MSSHPAASLYTPTSMEEAYAVYVYNALFGKLPPGGSIYLESKSTLKTLERSDVDGIILRTIWSVADPDNLRCLTDIAQFHVVLRLIALAQDGVLEKEITKAFESSRHQTTPVTVFKKTLWMTLDYTDCPLPSFQGMAMPEKNVLEELSNRLRGVHQTPSPAPAPIPMPTRKHAPASTPAPTSAPMPRTPEGEPKEVPPDSIPDVIKFKKKASLSPSGIESAIQQIETLGVNSPNPKTKQLKELDPDNFELLQEQAALQSAIMESNTAKSAASAVSAAAKPEKAYKSFSHGEVLSEEEALQQAIYESTYAASSPKPAKKAAASLPKSDDHKNWLRMSSLNDSTEFEKDSDDEYHKKKNRKGDPAYQEYVSSLGSTNCNGEVGNDQSETSAEFDKKPAAKPSPAKSLNKDHVAKTPPSTGKVKSKRGDDRVDEYPQAVQELVMNGFELEKAIQGYKMIGANFDDIVLFLTSNTTIKELVINGFNIHKVVQAYDLLGDNMDDLLAYLMANAT